MADSVTDEIRWYSPDPRAIIELDGLRIHRSLRRCVALQRFDIRLDTAFEAVMRACAQRTETWISEEIIQVYCALAREGHAHSVESWYEGELVGGLYGVSLGGAFFGESMFSRMTDASKVALVALVHRLRERGFQLLDIQFMTDHLRRLGATEIPRSEYISRLKQAQSLAVSFHEPPTNRTNDP